MALIGTISGSNGTSQTAITGSLVIANTTLNFPSIASDAALFVSGAVGGDSKAVIGGDLVVSGTTKTLSDLTLSGSNVYIGGSVSFNNDLVYLDKANDRVGIGTSIPESTLTVQSQGTGNVRGITGIHYDNTTAFSQFKFIGARSRGTVGSPTAVQADDSLVSFNARGRTDTGLSDTVGGLYIYAKQNWTSTNTPTYITLRGVAAGAGTAVSEWVKFESTGITATSFTGSLTKLSNGTSYLVAGAGAGITTGSAGEVTISAVAAGADTYVQFNDGGTTFGGDAGLTFDKTTDSLTVAGNITGSNLRLTGDIAVVGGDLTSTAATFNLATNLATQLNIGGTTPTISIGTSTGQTTVGIATGGATVGGVTTPKTVNIGTNTEGSAAVFVNIGSPRAREGNARITLHNEVLLTSGTIIGSSSGVNSTFTLISSGNIINRLDTDNNGPGHRFEVQDYLGGTEFAVNENGDVELTGNLLITGSSLSTGTTTTFNLLATALTGTLNVGSLVKSVNIGGSLTTSSFTGEIGVSGKTNLACVVERIVNSNGGTGTVNFDLTTQGIFYVNNPAGNITANFIKVPVSDNRVITPTIIMSQSATPRIVNAVQIDTVAQTINWSNGVVPTGNAGKQDVFGFSLIRSGSAWKVLGQMSTYG